MTLYYISYIHTEIALGGIYSQSYDAEELFIGTPAELARRVADLKRSDPYSSRYTIIEL